MSRDSTNGSSSVARKIAEAAMKINSYGSSMAANDRLMDALCGHLERMIGDGERDAQTLLEEGLAFLRRQETKRMR